MRQLGVHLFVRHSAAREERTGSFTSKFILSAPYAPSAIGFSDGADKRICLTPIRVDITDIVPFTTHGIARNKS